MKTIHIQNVEVLENYDISSSDADGLKKLINELYEYTLKNDTAFHFFYEPELIIRISSESCLTKVKAFLSQRNIPFEEYDYPFPGAKGKFGEEEGGIVATNLDLFLPVFHAHSVAAITMDDDAHKEYLERVLHTAFNSRFLSREYEGKILMELAHRKLQPE